jgi:hypothetical protein
MQKLPPFCPRLSPITISVERYLDQPEPITLDSCSGGLKARGPQTSYAG